MDLHEDEATNTVTATFELPGLKKEDVNIDVHDGRLVISGETKSTVDKEEGGYAIKERKYGKFSRTLRLPEGIKVSVSHLNRRMDELLTRLYLAGFRHQSIA